MRMFKSIREGEVKEFAAPSPRIRLRPKAGFGGQERGEVRTDRNHQALHVAATEAIIRGRCLTHN